MAMSVLLSMGEHVPWDLGRTAGTRAQSGVTNTSHRTPAMAGPSDGWVALGCTELYTDKTDVGTPINPRPP